MDINETVSTSVFDEDLIIPLKKAGILESAETGFADFCTEIYGKDPSIYYTALALVWAARNQHVCLDPEKTGLLFISENNDMINSECDELRRIVKDSLLKILKLTGSSFIYHSTDSLQEIPASPVIHFDGLLYLHRYYTYEALIAGKILERLRIRETGNGIIEKVIDMLFPPGSDEAQKNAVLNSCKKSFSVISGGPGTGKTTTAVKIALLHIAQELDADRIPRIFLSAPTGKAALRLFNSVNSGGSFYSNNPDFSGFLQYLPDSGKTLTIHRMIPLISEYKPTLVIIDETSMLDVSLLYRMLTSLNSEASLVFLGDRDQLSSVQSGFVMADLCSVDNADELNTAAVTILEKSFRFSEKEGIGRAAYLIKSGNADEFISFVCSSESQTELIVPGDETYTEMLTGAISSMSGSIKEFARYTLADDDTRAIRLFDRFRILCAHRSGPWGVDGINETVENILSYDGYIDNKSGYYHNMPLMILKNDYRRMLFNGDTGLVRRNNKNDELWFTVTDETAVKRYNPGFLTETAKVFAMTVHKSQGSEFDSCLIILPPKDSPLLTNELLYTAVTRARKKVVILSTMDVLKTCILRKTERMSGLSSFFKIMNTGKQEESV